MSIVLPKELKSQKTNSLPDDLKAIAEELIAKKFDVREEVIPEVDDFFLDPDDRRFGRGGMGHFGIDPAFAESRGRPHSFADEPSMGDRRGFRDRDVSDVRVQIQPWDRLRVAEVEISYPTFDNLVVANRKLDMENIRRVRPREFIMHPEFYNFLCRDQQVGMYLQHYDGRRVPEGAKEVIGEIMGCQIVIARGVKHCILRAEF